jgi:hypothetical protein
VSTTTATRERPIIFSAEMVRAILNGRKTQTRRVVKPQPMWIASSGRWCWPIPKGARRPGCSETCVTASREWHEYLPPGCCPYGDPGDRLWVREAWALKDCGSRVSVAPEAWPEGFPVHRLLYVATDPAPHSSGYWWNKRSPIHMPRWASRITLEVTGVCVERLQEITDADAEAEGVEPLTGYGEAHLAGFVDLWEEIHGPGAWERNDWVWVISFRRLEP